MNELTIFKRGLCLGDRGGSDDDWYFNGKLFDHMEHAPIVKEGKRYQTFPCFPKVYYSMIVNIIEKKGEEEALKHINDDVFDGRLKNLFLGYLPKLNCIESVKLIQLSVFWKIERLNFK